MAVEQPLPFSALLRRHRRSRGLTQEKLSDLAGVSVHAISDLERGIYVAPHQSTVALLAGALGLAAQDRSRFLESADAGRKPRAEVDTRPDESWWGREHRLIGRRNERATLERHINGEGPSLLLLSGEPGIGKTRLLQEAIRIAAEAEVDTLWGRCDRRSGQNPYTPVSQALQHFAERQPRNQIRAALKGASWLVRLLPELHEEAQAPFLMGTLAAHQERRLIFDSVTRFLSNSAGPRGLLLVLDDLQWAGPDALDLLASMVRSASGIPLRAIAAYRDTDIEFDHPLSSALGDLAQGNLASVLPIAELSSDDTADLLESLIDDVPDIEPEIKQDIIAHSDGVPFFLVGFFRACRFRGPAACRSGSPATALESQSKHPATSQLPPVPTPETYL